MPVQVQGPDGQTYQFPDGTDKSAAIGYFKKKGIGVKAASPASPAGDWRDPLTRIEPHQAVHSASDAGREVMRGVGNVGAGALGVVLRPVSTAEGVASSIAHPIDTAKGLYRGLRDQPLETIEQGIGQTAVLDLAGRAVGPAARALKSTSETMRRGVTGTGPRVTADLVRDTKAENAAEVQKAEAKNTETATKRKATVEKVGEKRSEARAENEAKEGVASRKEALQRGVEHLDPKLKTQLEATEEKVNTEANRRYNELASKLNHVQADPEFLPDALLEASEKIKGSDTEPTILRDIEKKGQRGESFSYEDMQGYRSELGRELRKGSLPGDVFHAYKGLQDSITGEMERIAKANDMGPQFRGARDYYRNYAETFLDRDAVARKALDSKERGGVTKAFRGKDQSGIQRLAQFDPELARRLNTVRGYADEAAKTRPVATRAAEPGLPPKTAPVEAKVNKIGPEEVRGAKTKALEHRVNRLRSRGEWIASGAAGYQVLHNVMTGNLGAIPGNVFEGGIAVAGVEGITRILENPSVVKLLTEPTAKDIAQIPPEMRGDFPAILKAAKAKGIRVDPRITAVLGITALNGAKAKKLQEISDQYRQAAQ